MIILIVLAAYLLVGLLSLTVFDLLTGRVRQRFGNAAVETQSKLAGSGNYVGQRMALVITALATLIFWPVVIYGFIESKLKERKDANKTRTRKEL